MNRRHFLRALSAAAAGGVLSSAGVAAASTAAPTLAVGRFYGFEWIHTERIERYQSVAGRLGYVPWLVHYHTKDAQGNPEFETATLFAEYPTEAQLERAREDAAVAFDRAWKRTYLGMYRHD